MSGLFSVADISRPFSRETQAMSSPQPCEKSAQSTTQLETRRATTSDANKRIVREVIVIIYCKQRKADAEVLCKFVKKVMEVAQNV